MPGRRHNDEERRLLTFWENPPENLPRPMLRSIEISGGGGLRGLDQAIIPLRFPLTAICGKNGSGKSTITALAALAFHSPKQWHINWTNSRYRRSNIKEGRSYYIFPDFFFYSHSEVKPNNVKITWRYFTNGAETSVVFAKSRNRWGRYGSRPEREVYYSPLSRVLPSYELNTVRDAFSGANQNSEIHALEEEYRSYLSYVMGTEYRSVEIFETERLSFPSCATRIKYSGFNMGGGENCVAQLLLLLNRLPNFGLLVVDEIESCLHPEAQIRLARVLVKLCWEKKVQIVCSTHSETFLDALPREARLLVQKNGDTSRIIEAPSTRFAVYEMKGEVQPELTIYCEDRVAAVLIEESVCYDYRRRLKIIDVGNGTTVIRQGVCHNRAGFRGGCLCVPDGDTKQSDINKWVQSETDGNLRISPAIELLPGDSVSPERWILDQLEHEDYRNNFARELGCDRAEARAHVQAMYVDLDHHRITETLRNRTGFDQDDCLRRVIRSVAAVHPGLDALRNKIASLLD